jgi:four helix bundle protein
MLDYKRLDVYQSAISFVEVALRLVALLPRGHSALADQLRRAAISVPLNIAEGSAKRDAERAHFHRIARGSAMECGAIVDVIGLLGVASETVQERSTELLERTVAMLSRMCAA